MFRVYNGLDLDRVAAALDENSVLSVKKEFGLEDKGPIVGIVANVDRWKGQIIVLQAIKVIKKDYPDIKCLIVGAVCKGAEHYQEELELFVAQNGLRQNVIFTGFRRDVFVIMNMLEVVMHASVSPEPFGRVILEGMALAKPIIGTNGGGPAELIVDGETGILVPMGDADAMAKALAFYLADMDRARQIGRRGQQRMTDHFSIERTIEETEKIYAQVLDDG